MVEGKGARFARLQPAAGAISLAAGFLLGTLAYAQRVQGSWWLEGISAIGTLWVNALRMAVIPLTLCLLITGICSVPSGRSLGRWGIVSIATFAAMLAAAAAMAVGCGYAYLGAFGPDASLKGTAALKAVDPAPTSAADWLSGLLPQNVFEALVKGDLLPIMAACLLIALAVRTLEPPKRELIVSVLSACRDALLTYVRWVVVLLPIGAFCLAFAFAAKSGLAAAGAALQFVIYTYALLIAFAGILYLAACTVGRLRLRRFAAELWPAQEIAIGTRSSLAALPSLMEASRRLSLPEPAHSAVLPLAASLLKVNRPLTAVTKLLFAAALFGITVQPMSLLAFVAAVLLLSIATPGIPSAGSHATLAAYAAAGIPLEGVLLLDATEAIVDIGKTALNVTGYLCSAAVASRFSSEDAPPNLSPANPTV